VHFREGPRSPSSYSGTALSACSKTQCSHLKTTKRCSILSSTSGPRAMSIRNHQLLSCTVKTQKRFSESRYRESRSSSRRLWMLKRGLPKRQFLKKTRTWKWKMMMLWTWQMKVKRRFRHSRKTWNLSPISAASHLVNLRLKLCKVSNWDAWWALVSIRSLAKGNKRKIWVSLMKFEIDVMVDWNYIISIL